MEGKMKPVNDEEKIRWKGKLREREKGRRK